MSFFNRQLYKQKPSAWGPVSAVQASIFKNAEKLWEYNPAGFISYIPLYWFNAVDYIIPTRSIINSGVTFNEQTSVFAGNTHLDLGNNSDLDITDNISFLSIITPSSSPDDFQIIAGKYDGTSSDDDSWMFRNSSTKAEFFIRNTSGTTWHSTSISSAIYNGSTHFIAGTYDGAKLKCYVDNKSASTDIVTTIRSNPTIKTMIGKLVDGSLGYSYRGSMHEFLLCNTALTQEQILYKRDNPYFLLHRVPPVFYSVPSGSVGLYEAGTSWLINATIERDSQWRVNSDSSLISKWRVFEESKENTSWGIYNSIVYKEYTSWSIFNSLSNDSSWKILKEENIETAWSVFISNIIQTQWSILSGEKISTATAWGVYNQLNLNTDWRLMALQNALTEWKIQTKEDFGVAWDILAKADVELEYRISEQLQSYIRWRIGDTALESEGVLYGWDLNHDFLNDPLIYDEIQRRVDGSNISI